MISYVGISELDVYWPKIAPFVKKALEHSQGEITPEDVLESAKALKMQVWCIIELGKIVGAAVTEILDFARVSSLRIVTLGGEGMELWKKDLYEALARYAKLMNCQRLEAVGRKGFIRALADLGFEEAYIVLVRNLNGK